MGLSLRSILRALARMPPLNQPIAPSVAEQDHA